MNGPVGVRVRLFVTVLTAWWICWVGWGPAFGQAMAAARQRLETISGLDPALGLTALVGVACLACLVRPGVPSRLVSALLGVSLLWWVFIAALFFAAGLPLAGGLAAIGSIGGFVAYWGARR